MSMSSKKIFVLVMMMVSAPFFVHALTAQDVTVTTLQTFLEQKGFLPTSFNDGKGIFGPQTKKALVPP